MMITDKRLNGIEYIDVSDQLPKLTPFWMITRWFNEPYDICAAEREEAKRLGVTDVDDFEIGLSYNREADVIAVAIALSRRFKELIGVVSGEDCRIIFLVEDHGGWR